MYNNPHFMSSEDLAIEDGAAAWVAGSAVTKSKLNQLT